jgi:cytoskeleton protein RodZ
MSEVSSTQPSPEPTAGALLRQARQARGLHLMALSASLKVAPGRLEAMEEDRWHDLPDVAYARALAHTVSRALGIDPQPVLSSLPAASQPRLETLDEGLDEPFRETPSAFGGFPRRYRWTVVGLGLILAPALWWWLGGKPAPQWASLPGGVSEPSAATSHSGTPPASNGPAAAFPAPPLVAAGMQPPADAPRPPGSTPGTAGVSVSASGASVESSAGLRIMATQASWIELREPQGQVRLSRLLGAGETVELPLAVPVSLTVGNAAATGVWVNGQPIDLIGSTRENVARIELR